MSNCNTLVIYNTVALTETLVTRICRNMCKMDLVAVRPTHTVIARMAVMKSGVR